MYAALFTFTALQAMIFLLVPESMSSIGGLTVANMALFVLVMAVNEAITRKTDYDDFASGAKANAVLESFMADERLTFLAIYLSTARLSRFEALANFHFHRRAVQYLRKKSPTPISGPQLASFVRTKVFPAVLADLTYSRGEAFADKVTLGEYQLFCSHLLKLHGWGVKEAELADAPGVDMIVTRDDISAAVQCRKDTGKVSASVVLELIDGMEFYGCERGLLIAPCGFTDAAKRVAQRSNIQLIDHHSIPELTF